MLRQILGTKRGKWAVALCGIAIIAAIGSLSKGSAEALPGALILLGIAAVLIVTAIIAIKNQPPAPSNEELGVRVSQEAIDAFFAYGTLPKVDNSPVILADGEQAVYACHAERIETKNRKLGTTGSRAGISFRVAKGVSLRTGGKGSESIYGDVEMVHAGEFVVTTKRVVFVATSRAFEEKTASISAVAVDGDCLAIVAAKESYALRLPVPEYPCEIIKHCIKNQ